MRMCGIAGVLYRDRAFVGRDLGLMLDGCQHRGRDSTGMALYGGGEPGAVVMRVYLGDRSEEEERQEVSRRVVESVERQGGKVLSTNQQRNSLRLVVDYTGDPQSLSYTVQKETSAEIFSLGRSLEIIKDVGTAHDLDAQYHTSDYEGSHGIGHVRLATESAVDVRGAHPFWAYGFYDVAIVHNGQITNYFKMKRGLQKKGYEFRTENDSELIAVYLADKLSDGAVLTEALQDSVEELDGTFSFLVSTSDSIGYAKDHLAAKPMVVLEKDDMVALASEEVSIQRLYPDEDLTTFEPLPGTYRTWSR